MPNLPLALIYPEFRILNLAHLTAPAHPPSTHAGTCAVPLSAFRDAHCPNDQSQ